MKEAHFQTSVASASPLIDRPGSAADEFPRPIWAGRSNVIRNICILIVPMLVLSGVLLGLVFRFRMKHVPLQGAFVSSEFSASEFFNNIDEPGVYYVDVSATRLIFVASWSSSIAPMLVSSIVALWSIQVAQGFARASAVGDESRLPTPYQLALTLSMLNSASLSALYDWAAYALGWKARRQSQGSMLINVGSIMLGGLFLSSLVFIADTWLHFVTKPVEFITYSSFKSDPVYSFALTDDCINWYNDQSEDAASAMNKCALNIAATNVWLMNASATVATLNNISETTTILTYDGTDTPYTYLSIPSTSPAAKHVDYVASTFGFKTKCHPITTACDVDASSGAQTPFKCADTFQGELNQHPWNMVYFIDSNMSSNATASTVLNPFYFGWAALVGMNQGSSAVLNADPEITGAMHGGTIFALLCEASSYDVVYTSENGTATHFDAEISNTSVSSIIESVMIDVDLFDTYLQQAASVYIDIAASAQDLADLLALSYSKAALSVLSATVTSRPAIKAESWTSTIVSRVPVAPLFMLVAANLSFVVVGLVLLTIILWSSGNYRAGDVHERLSIFGLVAERFESSRASKNAESVKELFEEYDGQGSSRVELVQASEGGWKYRVHVIS